MRVGRRFFETTAAPQAAMLSLIGRAAALFIVTDPAESALLSYLSIADTSVTEGNSGTSIMTFTVQSSRTFSRDVQITFATSDGTATAGVDYVATSGTSTITSGSLSVDIPVTINGDLDAESNETLTMHISNPVYL